MKNLFILTTAILLFATLTSCEEEKYPKYSLTTIEYIPDSLKERYLDRVAEITSSASYHMTGGQYEDAYETIARAEVTVEDVYAVKVIGLRKQIDDSWYNDITIKPSEFSAYEQQIFDSLLTNPK
jgi:hypothetical protein